MKLRLLFYIGTILNLYSTSNKISVYMWDEGSFISTQVNSDGSTSLMIDPVNALLEGYKWWNGLAGRCNKRYN